MFAAMDFSTPFFSIVLPTYNRAHLLNKPIESVLAQTFTNWQLVVVDDGSTDSTKEVVTRYNDPRILYVYQKNAERSAARNNGINHSTGNYICFLDSDDFFLAEHLQGLAKFISENSIGEALVFTNQRVSRNGLLGNSDAEPSFNPQDAPSFFIRNSIVPGRLCISKTILTNIKFDEKIVIVEDTDLWFRISCTYPSFYLPQACFVYEIHEGNSVNIKNNAYKTRLDGLTKTFKKEEASRITTRLIRETLSSCYFGIVRYHVARGAIFEARVTLITAILKYPEVRLKEKVYLLLYPRESIRNIT